MSNWIIVLGLLLSAPPLAAEPPQISDLRHTYSIIAHDPATGAFAGGVQSHWFNVGSMVLWAEAGVGVVATQSFVEPRYGNWGLAMMREGITAQAALTTLTEADEGKAVRQVAMIDANGVIANFTGEKAIVEHCDMAGETYSVQANLMWKPGVCEAMARAFESTGGDLANRIMAALDAAQLAGGDIRGKQSAALLVVEGERGTPEFQAQTFNLRVDDSNEPLKELHRLLKVARAYRFMDQGDGYMADGDMERALESYRTAMETNPGNHEMIFWTAVTLASVGDMDQAEPLFSKAFAMWPLWRELVPRLPASDVLPDDEELISRIINIE